MSKEAMKLALEALIAATPVKAKDPYMQAAAIVALEKALEKLAEQPAQQEPVGCEWTPCMKLPVVVHVRKQRLGEAHVSTREGITPVHPDDLIMRGVSGEEYPIGRAIFEQTYTLDTSPQAQQEPVAWGIIASNTGRICQVELDADEVEGHNPKHIVPLCHCSQAQRKPLASGKVVKLKDAFYAGFESYETPAASYSDVDKKWAKYAAAHGIKENT